MVNNHDPNLGTLGIDTSQTFPSQTVAQLAGDADLVVEVEIKDARPQLNSDQTHIVTVYTVDILRELLKAPTLADSVPSVNTGRIEIEVLGGGMTINGRDVIERADGFGPFQPGQQLVLFLKKEPRLDRFEVPYGPDGYFSVDDDHVRPLPSSGTVNASFTGASLDTLTNFVHEVASRAR